MADTSIQANGIPKQPASKAPAAVSSGITTDEPVALATSVAHPSTVALEITLRELAINIPAASGPVAPEAPTVREIERIDYDDIAKRVTSDAVIFSITMQGDDSVELFLQFKEFVRIATEETDAPIDHNRVRSGTSDLTQFLALGAAHDGSDGAVDGMTFRQELRKCIYATAMWEAGNPDAKVDDVLAEHKKLKKKKADALRKKAENAAKKKEMNDKKNETNWKKQKKAVLVEECKKRGFNVTKETVPQLRSLLIADDKRVEEEKAAEQKKAVAEQKKAAAEQKAAAEENSLEDVSVIAEGEKDNAMDEEGKTEKYIGGLEDEGPEEIDDPSNEYF